MYQTSKQAFCFNYIYVCLNLLLYIVALTTSSSRNSRDTNFAGALRDLLLPMLTSLNQLLLAVKVQIT